MALAAIKLMTAAAISDLRTAFLVGCFMAVPRWGAPWGSRHADDCILKTNRE
jgi:hypothetical protein